MGLFRIQWPWRLRVDARDFEKKLEEAAGRVAVLEPAKAPKWQPPPIGSSFLHCSLQCWVVDHGYHDGSDWHDAVVCHYRDDRGRIVTLEFLPRQWDPLVANGLKVMPPKPNTAPERKP